MAEVPQASFIPKRTSSVPKRKKRSSKRIYLLSYVIYIFFFGTVLAGLAIWVYGLQIDRQLAATQVQLEEAAEVFSNADIERVRDFKKRMLIAEQLLNESVAVTDIFKDIEAFVSEDVTFTGFEFVRLPSGRSTVALTGTATGFSPIIYQRNLMNESPLFTEAELASYDYSTVQLEAEEVLPDFDEFSAVNIERPVTITFTYETEFGNDLIAFDGATEPSRNPTVTSVRGGGSTSPESIGASEIATSTDSEDQGTTTEAGTSN